MNRSSSVCRHPVRVRRILHVLLLLFALLGMHSATAHDAGPVFRFAPDSAVFDAAHDGNADALARLLDLLHRVGAAADFDIVLLGSVTSACPTPLCPEPLRLRTRVEAITDALRRAWPDASASFPIERLRWAFDIADEHVHADQLRLRLLPPDVHSATSDCPFTVEWRERTWPPPFEPADEPLWLAVKTTGSVVALDEDARIRIRYHGSSAREVEITLQDVDSLSVLHSGLWQRAELRLQTHDFADTGNTPSILTARSLVDDTRHTSALAGVPPDASRGIGDQLLAWPSDSATDSGSLSQHATLDESTQCVFRFQTR